MAILSDIILYPIKSCAGIHLREAVLTQSGLMSEHVFDREWMVVDPQGRFLTQREHPRMALIVPRIKAATLELRAPGMLRLEIELGLPDPQHAPMLEVQVWDDAVRAYDCDEVTATWFSQAIGVPCRLVRFHPDVVRATSTKWTNGIAASTMFADGYPVLIAGSASLADVNDKLRAAGREALPMNRFRPNLVIGDIGAFEEDYAAFLQFGATILKPVKPCSRCPIPSVDQATGVPGPDPLDVMQGYRARPELDGAICFGMNAIVTQGGDERIVVGQDIGFELAF
ncbi:MOSC domain-containing protein [Janthinobacterium sp. BJB1]|uniref:MOSC domain-containing protein n=1 Tax=Janthinobacterium sp. GW458P TaxID=1981504 RepID=UPI000A326317|nr:MOSC N-terminal beta barrel domain-containing protein [Janthinobacterium sp. GW458P]MBE3027405.1 MOSC N-terminal beta barrel domain-containing protein [Janthinobacterium sp. GW458P]PHV15722.1 MOSC domain-containing protein [Janthinobacterium sp. BJB303]PJC95697.1 MOSC domain-containing protein [Janthinobacterium sp. BJB1]